MRCWLGRGRAAVVAATPVPICLRRRRASARRTRTSPYLFPYLPHRLGYHKRVKAAAPLINQATLVLGAQCPPFADDLRLRSGDLGYGHRSGSR
jgi:hypothetical protein